MSESYYRILQVDPSADPEVIAAAYRRLAMKYHPDTTGSGPGSQARMQELNEAYAVLSDPARRSAYDRMLDAERRAGRRAERRAERRAGRRVGRAGQAAGAAPRPSAPSPAASQERTTRFELRSLGIWIGIAIVLVILTLVGFGPISPLEIIVILVIAAFLVGPVNTWLKNRGP
jgi:curved DNA-binding protein CbpA